MAEIMQRLQASDVSSQEFMDLLSEIDTVTVPSADAASPYVVWKVAEVAPLEDGEKLMVRSTAGNSATFNADGSADLMASNGTRRRLLDVGTVTHVRIKPAMKALPDGLSRWSNVWVAQNGDSKCTGSDPVVSNGVCIPCYDAVEKGSACWPGVKGAESVVCTSVGLCVNSKDRFLAVEDGHKVATDLICNSMYDFATGMLIPTRDPAPGKSLPCFGCTDKVAEGEPCWASGTASKYTCQSDGKCQLNNKKKK